MSQLKPTFFTSDWHIGHEKSLEFDKRPFRNLNDMHESLIVRYNSTVPNSGICYFLGDMGNKTSEIRPIISALKGTKVIILGNHDHGMNTMYNCGFDVVLYSGSFYIGDNLVTMSHCPLRGVWREDLTDTRKPVWGENWHGESRAKHQRHTLTDEGQFHLHGHIHSRKDKKASQKILDKQFDVGVTANNYTPVSMSQIESWVMTYGK
jgi:calcineurin-like phosphoesterase family protein